LYNLEYLSPDDLQSKYVQLTGSSSEGKNSFPYGSVTARLHLFCTAITRSIITAS